MAGIILSQGRSHDFFDLFFTPDVALTREKVATKPTHCIHTETFMFAVIWNPFGFHVIDKHPIGAKMNSHYSSASN
jgi:hypothetical protein